MFAAKNLQFATRTAPGPTSWTRVLNVGGDSSTSGTVNVSGYTEIFGEIEDEHDKEALTEVQVSENEYLFSARIDIDYLNEAYGFGLEESEAYDTLAGLILEQLERLPAEGDRVQIGACELVIEKVSERKIETVRLFHDN